MCWEISSDVSSEILSSPRLNASWIVSFISWHFLMSLLSPFFMNYCDFLDASLTLTIFFFRLLICCFFSGWIVLVVDFVSSNFDSDCWIDYFGSVLLLTVLDVPNFYSLQGEAPPPLLLSADLLAIGDLLLDARLRFDYEKPETLASSDTPLAPPLNVEGNLTP